MAREPAARTGVANVRYAIDLLGVSGGEYLTVELTAIAYMRLMRGVHSGDVDDVYLVVQSD